VIGRVYHIWHRIRPNGWMRKKFPQGDQHDGQSVDPPTKSIEKPIKDKRLNKIVLKMKQRNDL